MHVELPSDAWSRRIRPCFVRIIRIFRQEEIYPVNSESTIIRAEQMLLAIFLEISAVLIVKTLAELRMFLN